MRSEFGRGETVQLWTWADAAGDIADGWLGSSGEDYAECSRDIVVKYRPELNKGTVADELRKLADGLEKQAESEPATDHDTAAREFVNALAASIRRRGIRPGTWNTVAHILNLMSPTTAAAAFCEIAEALQIWGAK